MKIQPVYERSTGGAFLESYLNPTPLLPLKDTLLNANKALLLSFCASIFSIQKRFQVSPEDEQEKTQSNEAEFLVHAGEMHCTLNS